MQSARNISPTLPKAESSGTNYAAQTNTTRAHYIVRIGNEDFAATVSAQATNHWHFLSPQHLWGLPRYTPHVKVRARFEADISNPAVTTYIWFLSNGHGGPGRFLQVGIGQRLVQEPARDAELPIPADMMVRLLQGFDHWFEWRPVNSDERFRERVRGLPVPKPTYIPTLRYIKDDHPSLPLFEATIDSQGQAVITAATARPPAMEAVEADLVNVRREYTSPHSDGFVYLIHMKNTSFYKIGMSLDPELRLKTLQTGNPHALSLAHTRAVSDMRSVELALHRQFERQRVMNPNVREWFDLRDGEDDVKKAFSEQN